MIRRFALVALTGAAFLAPTASAQASLSLTISPAPRLFTWSKLDLTGNAPAKSIVRVFRNRGVPCGATGTDEMTAADSDRSKPAQARPVAQLGQIYYEVDGGDFHIKIAYWSQTFDVDEVACAYLYQETCDLSDATQCGTADGNPPDGFATGSLRASWFVTKEFQGFINPRNAPGIGMTVVTGLLPRARPGTVNVVGTCGNNRIRLTGRRWYLRNLRIRSDGSFSYSGPVIGDKSSNYDPPPPPPWPARPHVMLKGRFFVKNGQIAATASLKISVAGARCKSFSGSGGAAPVTDDVSPPAGYNGGMS